MAKANAVWGIDIGQCALKALRCTISDDGESIVADKYDFIEYPKILSLPDAEPEEMIKQALTQFLSRNTVLGDQVAISVSGQAGLSRFFKPPPVDTKTLPDIVKYEVRQQIPFPIEDVIWDWQQLGGTIVDGRAVDAEVGLFAMKRDAVYRALEPFDTAEVDVDYVQLSPLSIFNVVCHDRFDELPDPEEFDPENPPESVVVMSMGTDTTDLIVTNGIKLWLRNIPIGGNHFTKQLAREMKLTQAKAEHLKRNARASENPKAIFKAMRPVFGDLVNEVQRSLTYFQSNEKSAELSEIVLLGNAARLPGLRQFLNKQLDIDIAKINEFSKLGGPEITSQSAFSDNVLSFAPCYGLCLQGLKKAQVKTNLLPEEIVVERVIRAKKPWVLFSTAAIALGLLSGFFFKANNWWVVHKDYEDSSGTSWESAMNKVSAKDTASKRLLSEDSAAKEKLDKFNVIAKELKSASEDKYTWLELYSALGQAFPKDDRITGKADPEEVGFEDRKELYIDHVESLFHEDLATWFATIQPVHANMFIIPAEEMQAATSSDSAQAQQQEQTETAAAEGAAGVTGPGWVLEIRGHHFHNSDEALSKLNAGKTYLYKSLIKSLLNKKDVVLPFGGDDNKFSFEDIGISYPTITVSSDREPKTIEFDPTRSPDEEAGNSGSKKRMPGGGSMGGGGEDRGTGSSSGTTEQEDNVYTFNVWEYNFVVQMAWTPRSQAEIIAARETRRAAEAAADAAAAQAAAAAEQSEQ